MAKQADLHLYDVLLRPIITEEAQRIMHEQGKFVFEVARNANKAQIKEAVETIFDVTVVKVNTMVMPAKRGMRGRYEYWRSKEWKKAIVTLQGEDTIELFNV
jgi:large subunit ribosomal protein L23